MMNHYKSLSSRKPSWHKEESGNSGGSRPISRFSSMSTWMVSLVLLLSMAFSQKSLSQTYFTESFEGTWYLNGNSSTAATAAGPNAPSGWAQTRLTNNLPPVGGTTFGATDFSQIGYSGSAYAGTTVPYSGTAAYNTTIPPTPPNGTKALWFRDGSASGTNTRRMESPIINLSGSTSPVISFSYSYAANSTSLTIVASNDGGATWATISTMPSNTLGTWTLKSVVIPAAYKVANAKIGVQFVSTFGSNDLYFDNIVVREGLAGTANSIGGLWSSPATWSGGVIPETNVSIPSGVIVTVDQVLAVGNLTIDGTLQWNGTANAITVSGNLVVNSGGKFLPYSSVATPVGATVNIAGNFQNDGYANLAVASTLINFNGSGSALSGTGTFQGDGTKGIIRSLFFQNTGSNSISTSNNLIVTSGFGHTAGSLNTNGKLTIDNTAQVYGQVFNSSVASLAITNMGTLYNAAPVVFGSAVTQWTSGGASASNTRYVSGGNVYVGTSTAGLGTTAPTHTSGLGGTNGNLLWLGTTGTLGTPWPYNVASTANTQYFYGGNLYLSTISSTSTTPPTHTSGISGSYAYIGTVATATVNYDATTQTVRSLNLTNAGSGYISSPPVAISVGVAGGTGSAASATAVLFQQIAGAASGLTQKSGSATLSGGLTINSDAGAGVLAPTNEQASSGVGAISTTFGGAGYTSAPVVGFALPTALNLIQNPGSGYTTVPTVTVTGGNLVSGTALASSNFTITVNGGKVQGVYLTSTTATYSTLPTLTLTASPGVTATLEFPAGCLPMATANLGSNGQILSFTMNGTGFGYVAAPTVGIGTTSGTANGGTFTTVATAPTARVALYNLTINNFSPSPAPTVHADDAAIPVNRKINTLTLSAASAGLNLNSNLTLYGNPPLSLAASPNGQGSVINLGGNNLLCTWNGYGGASATFGASNTYIKNGSMTLIGRGGGSTFNYPFSGTFTWVAGSGTTAADGSNVTRVTVSDTAAPTTASIGTSLPIGARAYRVQFGNIGTGAFAVLPTTGTNPTVTLNFNSNDALTAYTLDQLLISDSSSLTGPWSFKSIVSGSGAITAATTGGRTTTTAAPGPIVTTGDNYYAWSVSVPTITNVSPLTVCANSGTFTITGTNLTGATDVRIGGTPVTSFTVVSATSITGVAGSGTDGVVSLVKAGNTTSGSQSVTVTPSPNGPTVTPASASIVLGANPNLTASGGAGTFNWFTTPTGGSPVLTGPTYNMAVCATTTLYVSENNGSCDGARTAVVVTVQPTVIASTMPTFCGTGGTTTLSVTPVDPSITYTWSATSGSFNTTTGTSVDLTVSSSSEVTLIANNASSGCPTRTTTTAVSVYPLPNATVTTSATGVCAGTSSTINSGLASDAFSARCITAVTSLSTPPVSAVTLINGSGVQVTAGANSTTNQDDNYWTVPVGFNFNYLGTNYSNIFISTNGILSFTAGTTSFSFPSGFPSASSPAAAIAVCARDMYFTTGSPATLKYWVEGIAPNRRMVVQYANVPSYDTRANSGATLGTNSAEAVFYETIGDVDIRVINSNNGNGSTVSPANSTNKLIGLQNAAQTIGAVAPRCSPATPNYWNAVQTEILSPQTWRFSPPANYNVTWSTVGPGNVLTTVSSGLNVFSYTATPSVTTTYNLSYTNTTTGCSNPALSDQVTMTILSNVAPSTTAVASASTICLDGSSNLSLTGNVNSIGNTDGLTYQWQVDTGSGYTNYVGAGATSAALTVTPTVASSYRNLVTVCNGTPVASSPVSIGYTNSIASSAGATRCGIGTVSLSATTSSVGASIKWYAAASGGTALFTGSPYTPTVNTTTTYYVAAETTSPDCSSPRVAVVATVTTPPTITLTGGSTTTICNGSSATLTTDAHTNGYDTFSFSPTSGSYSGGGVFSFSPTANTLYTVTASQSSGSLCGTTFTYTVNVNTVNVVPTASASTICLGQPVTLSATSTDLASGPSTLPGTYCTADSTGGAGSTPIQTVAINTLSTTTGTPVAPYTVVHPAVGAETTTLTAGQTYPLTITTNGATITSVWFDWNRNGTFDTSEWTQTWTSAASGTINVLVPTNALAGATGMRIRSRGTGNTNGSGDACTAFFSGTSEDFTVNVIGVADVTASTNYSWKIGAGPVLSTSSSFSHTPPALGANIYTVTATNPTTLCSQSANITVTTQNAGAAITTPPAATQTRCAGGTVTFTVAATGVNLTYQWRKGTTNLTNGTGISGATSATLTLTGLTAGDAGNYNVVVSSDCGAPVTSSDSALTVVTPLAHVTASPNTPICTGTPVTLTEDGGTATSWAWSGGATTNPYIVTPTATTTYTVTATSSVPGCTATANVTVTVNQTPSTVSVSAEGLSLPYAICAGGSVKLNAADGGYSNIVTSNESFDVLPSSYTTATVSGTTTTTATLDTAIKTQGAASVVFNTTGNSSVATYTLNGTVGLGASQSATLTFSHIASMEGLTTSFDYGYVEYSSDGGSNWTTFTASNYSGAADTSLFNVNDVRFSTRSYADWVSAFTSSTTPPTNALWKNESFTIPVGALTNQFKIRFRYTTDISTNYLGWWIDNVVINATTPVIPQYSWTAAPATTLYTDVAQTTVYNPATDFAPAVYANPTAATVFTATVTNGSCSNSANATVSIKALPTFTVSDKELCSGGGGVNVSPVGGDSANTYIWTPTAGLSGGNISVDGTSTNVDVITANPSSTASYNVTANNNTTGCVSTPHPFTVTVSPQAVAAAATPSTRIKSPTTSTTFTVSSLNAVAYQWQVREGSGGFINIDGAYTPVDAESYSGATTATLTINNISELMTGFSYRALVKGGGNCGFVIPSNAQEGVLTVQNIGFVANFPADFTLCESGDASFHIQTTGGTPENYIWQVSRNGGAFINIADGLDPVSGFTYAGSTTADLDVTGVTYSTDSYRYQVSIDDESVTSDFATLHVNKTIVGTQAPQNNSLCSLASTSTMSAKATGTISGVTWEYGTSASGPWTPVASGTPSNITYSSSLPAAASTDGERTATLLISSNATTPVTGGPYFYRAVFQRANGVCTDFTTTSGQLDITTPVLTSQPVSTSVIVTNSATFTVGISGAATYQWQYSTSPSSGFQDIPTGSQTGASYSGTTSATLTVTTSGTTPFAANNYYRARVTSGGCIVYSNAAQLTVTDYCSPTYASGSASGNSITRVVLGTLTNNSGASTSPFYTFYSNVTIPDLIKLSTNSVAITVGANANQYTGVWIDLNQNGVFEASEGVVSSTNTASGGTSTLSVTIPSTATLGQTRMRVRGGDDVAMLTSQACGATNSVVGETEDYLVNVVATPAPTVTTVPASACALSTITINGTNFYGVTAVTVNGTPVSSFTATSTTAITATLAVGTTSGIVSVTAAGGTGTSSSVTVNPLPAIPVITGGGAICGATTTSINATNGGDGTIYYQGITSNGTSTTTTGAQTITTAGTYYFRAVSAAGCWGPQASTTVQFLTAPVAPTTTSYTICPGGVIPVGQGLTSTSVGSNVTGVQTLSFNVAAQPVEVNAAPGNIVASATMSALPAGATVTSVTINYNGIIALGGSWTSETRLGLSGALINDAAAGASSANSAGTQNYTRTATTGITGTPLAGGTVNLVYWNSSNDNTGVEDTFPTGNGVASVIINYSYPNPSPISWFTAATGGTAIGTGTPFNPIGVAGSGLADSSTPGTYPFYAEVNNGNCTSTRTVANIIVQNAGPFTASSIAAAETSGTAANDGTICTGAAVTLTAGSTGGGGGLSYVWKVGATTVSTAASFTITPALTATTTYDLTISDACGQSTTVSRTINVNSLPIVAISSLTPAQARICGTGSVSMTATGASTYAWTPTTGLTPTTGSPVAASPTTTTSYTVVGTDSNGCVSAASAPQVITVGPAVTMGAVAATPGTICSGATAALTATATAAPATYVSSSVTFAPIASGAGTVTLANAGTASTALTSGTLDDGYWNGLALPFNFTYNGTSYSSVSVQTNGIISFSPFTTTTGYGSSPQMPNTATPNNIAGLFGDLYWTSGGKVSCYTSGSTPNRIFVIDYNGTPTPTNGGGWYNSGSAPTGLVNFQIQLLENGNKIQIHSTNITTDTSHPHTMGVENTGGTAGTVIAGRDNSLWTLSNDGTQFAPQSLSYSWTGSNGFTSSLQNPTTPALTANASYSVTATETTSGCFATGGTSVTVNTFSVAPTSISGTTTVCTGTQVILTQVGGTLGSGATYKWYTGSCGGTLVGSGPSLTITPATTTTYYVLAEGTCNTTTCASVTVTVNTPSVAPTSVTGVNAVCSGTPTTLTAAGGTLGTGATYRWYTASCGGTFVNAGPTLTVSPTSNTTYYVRAEGICNTTACASVLVSVTNCAVTQLSNCGSTPALPTVNTRIFAANTISGASAYRFRVAVSTAPSTYFYAVTANPSFRLTDVVGLSPAYGTTYNVDIQTEYTVGSSTVVTAYGPICTVSTQAATNITVPTNQCGQTLAAVNSKIYVNGVTGATMYTYRIAKQSAPTQYGYIETPYSNFRLTAPLTSGSVAIEHNTVYLVAVSVTTANGSSNFNGECQITTPAGPMTTLQASQCGDDETPYVIPTKSTKVYAADFVSGATYTFKLEQYSGATLVATKYATSPINYFDCNMFTGINSLLPNTNYHVYVAINYYGQGDYDHDCVVKTPAALKHEDIVTDFKAMAYPNPFANNFMIDVKSSSESSVNLKIYDMIGRLIEQRDVRISDLEATTIGDRYPSGVYNVVVSQESSVQTVRVVKR